jgi:hypothetical protein
VNLPQEEDEEEANRPWSSADRTRGRKMASSRRTRGLVEPLLQPGYWTGRRGGGIVGDLIGFVGAGVHV